MNSQDDSPLEFGVLQIHAHLDALAAMAHPEGGWGYRAGQPASIEPTCLALLALSLQADAHSAAIAKGHSFLKSCEHTNGSFRAPVGRPEAIWPTAHALFLQAALEFPRKEIDRTAAALLSVVGRTPDDPEFAELVDIDCSIRGWPWATGNFSWAEPTAWACFSLQSAGYGDHPRVREGIRLLLDRACDDGGINYGNRRVLGRLTEPLPEPTAYMLFALQNEAEHPRITAAVRYLESLGRNGDDVALLCWCKLALDLFADRLANSDTLNLIDERILENFATARATNWLAASPTHEALAALALSSTQRNVFRLTAPLPSRMPIDIPNMPQSPSPWSQRMGTAVRSFLLGGANKLRPLPAQSTVHIARVAHYHANLVDVLRRQYDTFRANAPLKNKRVVLKPNLVEYHRDKPVNTDPRLVAAVIELCKHEGAAEIIVAEGPGHCRNAVHLVRASGLGDVLSHYNVRFVDINHDEPVKQLNLGRLTRLDHLFMAQTIVHADVVISLPKVKTHHWAGATLSLKNLFGTLPGTCYGWPKNELHWRGIDNSIVDIALTRTPELTIVDGIVGMEGDGPINGTPKALGALIMGTDLVAVDATCCRLMQLDPQKVGYLSMAHSKRLGMLHENAIEQVGEPIPALATPFEVVPHFQSLRMALPGGKRPQPLSV